jgi:predicted ATPase
MQQELREYPRHLAGEPEHRLKPVPLEARIGINTGEVVVRTVETGGKVEYTPIGHTANLASRLQTVAPPGSIVVSEYTWSLVEGYFELRPLGPVPVRGISEPINVYEVTGLGPLRTHFQLSARRGLTRFVGRERELEQMKHALELARSGHGQLVAIVAEAGTGKSRLVYELKATLPAECKVLEAYSVSHGKASAWLPVLDLLRGYFAIQDADDAASRREKVRAGLSSLDPGLSVTASYLCGLLGIQESPDPLAQMDPQIRRQRTLDAIRRIFLRESLNQPVVVIFEDLHWIDAQTQALLDLLTDSISNSRVLLLVNYRPEYRHAWTNKTYYSQFRLDPLHGEGAAAMLAALLGDSPELAPLKRLIAERTGGNPFFIEEIVKALFDEGALMRNGAVKVTRSLSQLRLPPTVQGILAARIDRQPGEHKQLLQTLAVMGRESSLVLIRKVASLADTELQQMLADLQAGEFIFEQPAATGVEYVFKHALTQEVAYNSLLIERRKLLHERAAQALESLFAQHLDDHLDKLAQHYSHSDNVDKAVEYLRRVGEQAMQRCALPEAISGFNSAVNLLQKQLDSPERMRRELHLQLALGQTLIPVKGWAAAEVEGAFIRGRELCEQLGDAQGLFRALMGLWAVYYLRGVLPPAYELAKELWRMAQAAQDSEPVFAARIALGDTLFSMGELLRAREQFEEIVSLYHFEIHSQLVHKTVGLVDYGVSALSFAADTLDLLGYPEQALRRSHEALALANALSHPHSVVFAWGYACGPREVRRDLIALQEAIENVTALSAQHGFTDFIPSATIHRGSLLVQQGSTEQGISLIKQGVAAYQASGMELYRPIQLCLIAQAYILLGRFDDASMTLSEALYLVDQHDERCWEPEVHRFKGELLLKRGDLGVEEARSCFQQAIEIAREQSAKSYELRATISLARLLAKQDRRQAARAMLAEIYNWFTEGFDTADLKDAKALLDELSD